MELTIAAGGRERAPRSFSRALKDALTETLWPTRCAVCDAPGELLCERCREELPFIDATRACPACGAPHGTVQCTECNDVMLLASKRESLPYAAMASALELTDATHRMIVAYKDGGEQRLSEVLGAIMAAYANPSWIRELPLVTFIPSSRKARARRGFDHGELTSRAVARILNLPHGRLFGDPESHDQRKLSRQERAENMAATMKVLPGAELPRAVIVVDDVCTTGATLFSAADALEEAGVKERYALTFARTLT